jgi:hypothetical protein
MSTSIGIEWETRMCVFDSTEKLKELDKEHLSCDKKIDCSKNEKCKEGWTLSLENDKGLPKCLNILEAQIGVAVSPKENEFNKNQLKLQIESFSCFFKSIIDTQIININDTDYPIVMRNDKIYCNGLPEKIKINETIGGKPQITFGIDLKYIFPLFKYISKKYEEIIDKYYSLEFDSFYRFYKYIKETVETVIEFINSSEHVNTLTIKNDIIGFLCLVFYKKITIDGELTQLKISNYTDLENLDFASYLKSYFVLKNRSNLKQIYNYLLLKYNTDKHIILFLKNVIEHLYDTTDTHAGDIEEWNYPMIENLKENYNIFLELRDVSKFILVCNDSFYIDNIREIMNDNKLIEKILTNIQYPEKFKNIIGLSTFTDDNEIKMKLAKFLIISIDNLYKYCESFMNIFDIIFKNSREEPNPDIPFWSFSNKQKKDKLKNKNK